jgi:hypothetical protein
MGVLPPWHTNTCDENHSEKTKRSAWSDETQKSPAPLEATCCFAAVSKHLNQNLVGFIEMYNVFEGEVPKRS